MNYKITENIEHLKKNKSSKEIWSKKKNARKISLLTHFATVIFILTIVIYAEIARFSIIPTFQTPMQILKNN